MKKAIIIIIGIGLCMYYTGKYQHEKKETIEINRLKEEVRQECLKGREMCSKQKVLFQECVKIENLCEQAERDGVRL